MTRRRVSRSKSDFARVRKFSSSLQNVLKDFSKHDERPKLENAVSFQSPQDEMLLTKDRYKSHIWQILMKKKRKESTVTTDEQKLDYVYQNLIGGDTMISTAFGERVMTYCDYVASGRPLKSIEDFMLQHVLPTYANTHTETSLTGLRTNMLREQARQQVADACGVDTTTHSVIFIGSGVTAAMDLLIQNLPLPFRPMAKYNNVKTGVRPVVIHSEFEHHSNILPWRESNAIVCVCKSDKEGKTGVDLNHLEQILETHKENPMIIGSFSAASNVDGTLTDVNAVCKLIHEYNGLAIFDFAAAAPYVPINMQKLNADAIAISPHKFVGGAGTPGVLIIRNSLCDNRSNVAPNRPGGGVVTFVTRAMHSFETNTSVRNESGTPDIAGAIRAGCVFKLKQDLGPKLIESRDEMLYHYALKRLSRNNCPNLHVLGNPKAKRLPTLSFLIIADGKLYLHPSFVSSLLNDVFGIQSRSGCMCAGPFGAKLLDIGDEQAKLLMKLYADSGSTLVKPGFTRLNIPYFFSMEEVDFVLDAIDWISKHGFKLLPLYSVNTVSGVYKMNESLNAHNVMPVIDDLHDLNTYDFFNPAPKPTSTESKDKGMVIKLKQSYFGEANSIVERICSELKQNINAYDHIPEFSCRPGKNWMLEEKPKEFIWFLRKEQVIAKIVTGKYRNLPDFPLFMPKSFRELNDVEVNGLKTLAKGAKLEKGLLSTIRVHIPSALGIRDCERAIEPPTRPNRAKKKSRKYFMLPKFKSAPRMQKADRD